MYSDEERNYSTEMGEDGNKNREFRRIIEELGELRAENQQRRKENEKIIDILDQHMKMIQDMRDNRAPEIHDVSC
jgi:hypothetical protein